LAKAAQSDDISLSSDLVGTLRYMAPEQFRGTTDHRSDIYSLGLTLYELLALRSAYEETDQSRLIQRIVQGPSLSPPSISSLGVPRDLETIILKAASHDVSQRRGAVRGRRIFSLTRSLKRWDAESGTEPTQAECWFRWRKMAQ
jgi:serine/threonine protein kinase